LKKERFPNHVVALQPGLPTTVTFTPHCSPEEREAGLPFCEEITTFNDKAFHQVESPDEMAGLDFFLGTGSRDSLEVPEEGAHLADVARANPDLVDSRNLPSIYETLRQPLVAMSFTPTPEDPQPEPNHKEEFSFKERVELFFGLARSAGEHRHDALPLYEDLRYARLYENGDQVRQAFKVAEKWSGRVGAFTTQRLPERAPAKPCSTAN
jgi:hypothetical protein